MEIRKTLRNKRIELGLSQKFVGEKIKVAQSTLCRFEQGYKITNESLIIHKLITFYDKYNGPKNERVVNVNKTKNEQTNVESSKTKTVKNSKQESKKIEDIDLLEKDMIEKLQVIAEKEMQKAYKKILKRTLKKFIKEL
jgi:transcriptional regulator with XRE-family HTH domain